MIYMSFFVGLLLICKGGDWFVDAASAIARAFGIPKYIVGATIVSFATTMPEILVSVSAALKGSSTMAIGNAVGYPNQLHFSRAFKNVYGVSPREWRNKNQMIR